MLAHIIGRDERHEAVAQARRRFHQQCQHAFIPARQVMGARGDGIAGAPHALHQCQRFQAVQRGGKEPAGVEAGAYRLKYG